MKTILRVLRLEFIPVGTDLALLVLRLWLGLSLLLLHGWAKLSGFKEMSGKFSDPLGVGKQVSLGLAVFGEAVAPVLLVLGLFTRVAALSSAVTMGVAFFLVHEMILKGPRSGELAFIYLAGFVTLFLAGPGRFSIDGGAGKGGSKKPKADKPEPRRD